MPKPRKKKPQGGRNSEPPPRPASRRWLIVAMVLAVVCIGGSLALWPPWRHGGSHDTGSASQPRFQLPDEKAVHGTYAGSASCRECHREAYDLWAKSHHGLAERPFDMKLDGAAFVPERTFEHGTQKTEVRMEKAVPVVAALGLSQKTEQHAVERVIGADPLRQFLVPAPGGRLQTLEASYDPKAHEWFNVYGSEDRKPGEWGHWTGRGMNWNTMCAACHNTRVRKNYDTAGDTYATRMAEMTVSCEACHGPMKAHVEWQHATDKSKSTPQPDPTLRRFTRDQTLDTCGSCHARRGELTGDFHPGESFFDHYHLSIPDETDLFYPDGQVRDEDYELSAFLGSRMHAAGVRCIDCHQPHSAKTLLPGNDLCMRCHSGGAAQPGIVTPAPKIEPAAHSFHADGSAGNQCIACHMPVTTYMQRHPRHDHGFTIPDPLLTKQHGIPNACNRCHTDKDADWSLAAVEKWYGEKMNRPSRQRAQWLAAARKGDAAARDPLVALLAGNETPYWKASAANLLQRWAAEPAVNAALLKSAAHPSPLVRVNALQSLAPLLESDPQPRVEATFQALLDDPERSVRYEAAWGLRATLPLDTIAGQELLHGLAHNADQPMGQLQLGAYEFARREPAKALAHFETAVKWDPGSAGLRHELAIALSTQGRTPEAVKQLEEAIRLAPKEAEYQFKLGLASAELGRVDAAVRALEEAVRLDPGHARAWYNLGLGRSSLNQPDRALQDLAQAERLSPQDAQIPYARATILARLNRTQEARTAAQKALRIQPGYSDAAALIEMLSRSR